MFLLGIDLGTSSVKVSVVKAAILQTVAMTPYRFVNTTNVAVEFYDGDGSFGPALRAGIGCSMINMNSNASPRKPLAVIAPRRADFYNQRYENRKEILEKKLAVNNTLLNLVFDLNKVNRIRHQIINLKS